MEASEKRSFNRADNLFIPVAVLAAYLLLVAIDKDTNSIYDVFSFRIVPGMLTYGIPGILVCSLLLRRYVKKYGIVKSTALAVSIGIFSTFTFIIVSLQLLSGWGLL